MKRLFLCTLLMSGLALPATGEQFTTADEVRPILTVTKANWVALREYDGKDLVYFTQLLSWRCGLDRISYTINDGEPERFPTPPCHVDSAAPNAILAEDGLPYVSFPLGSVRRVQVSITYDDGGADSGDFSRDEVLAH